MQGNPADVVAIGGDTVTIEARVDFDDFYRAELPRLVALARALCGGAGADDLAQEAMLAAYRRWRHFSVPGAPRGRHHTPIDHLMRDGIHTRSDD